MSKVSLSSIPTAAALYQAGKLKAAAGKSQQAFAGLADRIGLWQGDITKLDVGAIVNAANTSLLGGGGVDGAIHRAAGKDLLAECRTLNGCETGEAKLTRGYNLPAPYIIHTVGPVYAKTKVEASREKLAGAYRNSLLRAAEKGGEIKTVAFPSISTGVYGYPIEDATRVALETVGQFLQSEDGAGLERVIFCTFSKADYEVYERGVPDYFPPSS
ncbi:A1pp-domain-containing protein [Microstroma glucosiphilum]|uniref:A1pp-domain-containing protein n=1 Tax=Pseudomicrostroma glucosiphilum TaxID=1684307 RepID=A0A316UGF4_9BASI|nr:A1pp-domain-containing protein [Pseudomicrostroma glucosiphilum]PWN23984.1 A1pp-domain-containing protein [Pseudomicrostroma glucosiphilum]